MLTELPELGTLDCKQISSVAGLACARAEQTENTKTSIPDRVGPRRAIPRRSILCELRSTALIRLWGANDATIVLWRPA
jgi:hypothetical protein